MNLDINGIDIIGNPSDEDLREVVKTLEDSFMILSEKNEEYVQVAPLRAGGYDLEYRDGDYTRHYRARREDFSRREITTIFQRYNQRDPEWNAGIEWERLRF